MSPHNWVLVVIAAAVVGVFLLRLGCRALDLYDGRR